MGWGGGLLAYKPHANLCILYFAVVGLVKFPISKLVWVRFLVISIFFAPLIFFCSFFFLYLFFPLSQKVISHLFFFFFAENFVLLLLRKLILEVIFFFSPSHTHPHRLLLYCEKDIFSNLFLLQVFLHGEVGL